MPENVMVNVLSKYGPYSIDQVYKDGIYFVTAEGESCVIELQDQGSGKQVCIHSEKSTSGLLLARDVFKKFRDLSKKAHIQLSPDGERWADAERVIDDLPSGNDIPALEGGYIPREQLQFLSDKEHGLGEIKQEILKEKHSKSPTSGNSRQEQKEPVVFISYNHKDEQVAEKVAARLEENGLRVLIDKRTMRPGEGIDQFILDCIQQSDYTFSIVSNNSLVSTWVGLETVTTFYHESLSDKRKFIAGYLDEDFFDDFYRAKKTKEINAALEKLDRLKREHYELGIDSRDLDPKVNRYYQQKQNLGVILERLRESLCQDIGDEKFDDGMQRIIDSIKA